MKKDNKKVEKKEEPVEIESTGTFKFPNNTFYVGAYKILSNGHKIRHGFGKLIKKGINGSSTGEEFYEGNWLNDKFNGQGVYVYSNGDVYKGEFKDGFFNGHGVYSCLDGTKYEGSFMNNRFHGIGTYYDIDGIEWHGEFNDGFYSSKEQATLKEERRIQNKLLTYQKFPSTSFYKKWEESVSKVDKKTAKEVLCTFFADKDSMANIMKEPFPKFEEKPYEKWNEIFKVIFNPANSLIVNVGQGEINNKSFKFVDYTKVLVEQFTENLSSGQIIETLAVIADRNISLGIVYNKSIDKWQVCYFKDEVIKVKK